MQDDGVTTVRYVVTIPRHDGRTEISGALSVGDELDIDTIDDNHETV